MRNSNVVIYQLTKRNPPKSSHAEKVFPAVKFINTEDIIYHPETGKTCRIRYAIGEESIYVDEQSEFAEASPFIPILNGMLRVNKSETALVNFLDATNQCANNPKIKEGRIPFFHKVDIDENAKKDFENQKRKGESVQEFWKLFKSDETIFKGVARLMGVDVDSAFFNNAFLKVIENRAEDFLNILDDSQQLELAERLQLIHEADQRNMINFALGKWSWTSGDGSSSIINVASGMNPHRALVDWTFTNESGRAWFGTLKGLMTDNPTETLATKNEDLTRKEVKKVNEMSLDEVSELARYYKIITWKAPFFMYNVVDEEPINLGKQKVKIIKFLKENDQALKDIKARIMVFKRME